jgi:hypothetical protein
MEECSRQKKLHKQRHSKVRKEKTRGLNQFGSQCIHTWICHNKASCITILNKQKCLFFFFKIGEQEGKTGLRVGTSGRGEDKGKGEGG